MYDQLAERAAAARRIRRQRSRRRAQRRRLGALILLAGVVGAAGAALPRLLRPSAAIGRIPTIALQPPDGTPVLRVGKAPSGARVAPGFLGFSLEYTALLPYAGHTGLDPVFLQLIRNLNPGQSPVLRFGGDSTDWSWIPTPGIAKPPGVNYTIGRTWLKAVGALVRALGARVIFGINLEAGRAAIAAAEGRALVNAVGAARVAALEIGNEPELYGKLGWYANARGAPVYGRQSSYDIVDYTSEFTRFARVLPKVPLAGPATGQNSWLAGLPTLLDSGTHVSVVTVHRYPLARCASTPGTSQYPTLANLLSPRSSAGLADSVAAAARVAHAHGAQLRVDELNSVSCRGQRGLSDTFASSLWVLDTLFSMARAGVDGVNIHTLPASVYHPFALVRSGRSWHWTVDPLYYGLLMFSRAAPAGSRLLPVSGPLAPQLRAWATRTSAGRTQVVVINEYTRQQKYVQVHIPGARRAAALTWLRAPSITATGPITLGGQTFGSQTSTGRLTGRTQQLRVAAAGGTYVLRLPPGSAAMLTAG